MAKTISFTPRCSENTTSVSRLKISDSTNFSVRKLYNASFNIFFGKRLLRIFFSREICTKKQKCIRSLITDSSKIKYTDFHTKINGLTIAISTLFNVQIILRYNDDESVTLDISET